VCVCVCVCECFVFELRVEFLSLHSASSKGGNRMKHEMEEYGENGFTPPLSSIGAHNIPAESCKLLTTS
jgi:hypothetical protein